MDEAYLIVLVEIGLPGVVTSVRTGVDSAREIEFVVMQRIEKKDEVLGLKL